MSLEILYCRHGEVHLERTKNVSVEQWKGWDEEFSVKGGGGGGIGKIE